MYNKEWWCVDDQELQKLTRNAQNHIGSDYLTNFVKRNLVGYGYTLHAAQKH